MQRNELIKNFAIGFIPIFVFIVADEFFGTEIGLLVAITVGIGYLIYYLLRYRRLEKFILFDTALIIVLGGISLLLHDEIFFKLKPALLELVMVILLGIHAFSSKPIMLMMSQRYLGEMELGAEQVRMLNRMSRVLFFVFLGHTLLIVYSAYYWSKEAWAFVSGGLFYIIFGMILAGQWLYFQLTRAKKIRPSIKTAKNQEWFDLLNEQGKIIGRAPRSAVHGNPQLIHPTVHLHIFNRRGQIYLQKRALSKDLYPGHWDTAVGGHILSGESVEEALLREAQEELDIIVKEAKPLFRYLMRNKRESEFVYSFEIIHEGPFTPNPAEIESGRFWSSFEIQKLLGQDIFTPNFEQEFALLKKMKRL